MSTVTISEKDEVWGGLSVNMTRWSCSLEEPRWQAVEFKPIFWHPFKSFCAVLNFTKNIFGSDVTASVEAVALKLHDSCPYIPPGLIWSCRLIETQRQRAVRSLNYLCVSLEARELYFCYDKLCIYTLLRWDFFFCASVHCSVFVIVNQCFNHYLYIITY